MKMNWSIYTSYPSHVFGFHGCDATVGEAILGGKTTHLEPSQNDYDWLGHGIYFWEANPARALAFAEERALGGKNSKGKIKHPFVLGAIIDLGKCLNLLDSHALQELQDAYQILQATESVLPSNGKAKLLRKLDCAVIQARHTSRQELQEPAYQTVRGVFTEGAEVYPGAGFNDRDHIQICVRDLSCIKGYFRPIHD